MPKLLTRLKDAVVFRHLLMSEYSVWMADTG